MAVGTPFPSQVAAPSTGLALPIKRCRSFAPRLSLVVVGLGWLTPPDHRTFRRWRVNLHCFRRCRFGRWAAGCFRVRGYLGALGKPTCLRCLAFPFQPFLLQLLELFLDPGLLRLHLYLCHWCGVLSYYPAYRCWLPSWLWTVLPALRVLTTLVRTLCENLCVPSIGGVLCSRLCRPGRTSLV